MEVVVDCAFSCARPGEAGRTCESRCRLQLYSEKTVDVLVDCMMY